MAQRVFTERYQIVRHVARGGMAEVYLAHDLLLDRPVALKVLFPEFAADRSFVERFRREARAAANLNHPNIVSIYDWGEEGGTYFIVMEYVEGRTLRDLIRAEGPLHPTRAAEIGADIAAALSFAHRNGVIHRDVKPGNVILGGLVKVADFGIARAGDPAESLTQTGAVMGTATYFSPEQAQGQQIDPRSDVYSLGVVLYELVTGRPPFTGDSPVAIAYKHVREEPVPPSRLNPDVPAAFDAVVLKAIAKDRSARYNSAEALRADLLRFAQGSPVTATAVPPAAAAGAGAGAAGSTGVMRPSGVTEAVDGTQVMPRSTRVYEEEEFEEEEERPARTGIYIGILAVLLAILAGLLFLLARELGVGGANEVSVPPLVGDTLQDAENELRDAGLKSRVVEQANDANEPGRVLEQSPVPGTKVKEGSTVRLTVTAPPETVAVPNVVGKSLDDAQDDLEAAKLTANVTRRADDRVEKDRVISQNPAASQRAPLNSAGGLVVSSGPELVSIPSLVRASEEDAVSALRSRGLEVAISRRQSSTIPSGQVISTDPGGGEQVPKGSEVTVVVSTGPPPTTTVATTVPPITITLPTITVPTTTTPPSSTTSTSRP